MFIFCSGGRDSNFEESARRHIVYYLVFTFSRRDRIAALGCVR
ncbi:hypothetical protein TSAR_012615 [Trichomalopsis sarcophagae]|uniref:Uncharacterized protein n=1 Tax=Trichomalopsis sarcophagae TaxID=543379 RepID=A0A232F4E5_9HYME|nr:hypothetical protein TSAR_012615 [Trichomalopsis sarcophagae]